ncbi:MAG: DoxX family protein [Chloroflexota bacterium]
MRRTLPATWGITIVRLMAGIILVVASYEKFSSGGLFGFVPIVTSFGFPIPQLSGVFVPFLELIGGLLVFCGLGARCQSDSQPAPGGNHARSHEERAATTAPAVVRPSRSRTSMRQRSWMRQPRSMEQMSLCAVLCQLSHKACLCDSF